ncbi:MFS transporter [Brevibacterium luteolum]|uniref:MFS transporter n=1 Tax=Brevibacterium luteolum TaxID=199591 RepID=UPI0023BAC353|nr:MFS transporter [Brevibacterium luteolum]
MFTKFAFIPQILSGIDLGNGLGTDLLMNGLQIADRVLGVWLLWLMPGRAMAIWTFVASAGFLLVLGLWHGIPEIPAIIIFGASVLVFTASTNIQYVYPPEMYETRFRSTGVGMAAAISHIGAAIAAFFFPVTMGELGTTTTLVLAAIFPIIGLIASMMWAPETNGKDIDTFA